MVGSKPNAYLSEEARLEAQRRMLAERYGLLSDDSDDNDDSATAPEPHSPPNGLAHAPPNGRAAPSSAAPSSDPRPSSTPFASSVDRQSVDGPPTSSPPPKNSPTASSPTTTPWPSVEMLDHAHSNRICAHFDLTMHPPPVPAGPGVPRDVRVTQICHYNSQLLESHHRKVAANDRLVSYPVGGHIRVIRRNSSERVLLKGHNSVVADIEFLHTDHDTMDASPGDRISILASVADDGSVYVWKLVSTVAPNQNHVLEIADAIRFEHPDCKTGGSYSRVAFRPGPNSIISDNGVGVAMLLLDSRSTDLRVVELVKMNDKMMVRDKFLKARNEIADGDRSDACLDAAAWLSESIMVTSRGGNVFLWAAANQFNACLARIPRESTTPVTDICPLNQEVLLLVVDHGRQIELWATTDIATDLSSISMQLRQTIRLFADSDPDVFCVTAVDPYEQLVTISNVRTTSFFALHYNRTAQAFDAVTKVPLKNCIYSFCMTRSQRPSFPSAVPTPAIVADAPVEEVGVWCIQPTGIQLVHLPAKDVEPRAAVLPEVYPKPDSKTLLRKMEKLPASVISQQMQAATGHTSKDATVTIMKRPARPPPQVKSSAIAQGANGTAPIPVDTGPNAALVGKGSVPQPKVVEVSVRETGVVYSDGKGAFRSVSSGLTTGNLPAMSTSTASASSGAATNSSDSSGKPATSVGTSVVDSNVPSGDDIADAILNAAKKAIASFEETASQRTANEKLKMDRLIESVTETAESNLEVYINSSMKNILAGTLIPKMSEMILDSREALSEKMKGESLVTKEHFEEAMDKCEINQMFVRGCKEMGRQIGDAVKESISSKYDVLIKPTMDVVNETAEDLTSTVGQLREEMSKLKVDETSNMKIRLEPEDIRQIIEEHINEGNVDMAFETALEEQDIALVMWVCGKFDAGTFFESHKLSQTALIALGQQLGHGLCEDDVEIKVDWLREVMLVLDADSEEIESISTDAVQELGRTVSDLRDNKEFVKQFNGLEKKLKTLSRLISSHIR